MKGMLAIVGVLALTLCGCTVTAAPKEGPVEGEDGNSAFSPAGAERVREERSATIDWSDGELLRTEIGLREDEEPTWVTADGPDDAIAVTIVAPSARIELDAGLIALDVTSGGPAIEGITLTAYPADDEAMIALLRTGVERDGLDAGEIEGWIAGFDGDAQTGCDDLGWHPSPGTRTGLDLQYGISCEWESGERARQVSVTVSPLS